MPSHKKAKRHQSHDRYFRYILQDLEVAVDFLKTFMKPKAQANIDWSTIEIYDTALFGENNKALYADAIFRAQTHAKEEVFIIVNHETKPDPLLSIRKIEYKLGTLKKAVKNKKKPVFIYFVTWQGAEKVPAHYPKSIADYFEDPELAKALFLEDDVIVAQEISDEVLLKSGKASILTIFMKYANSPKFPDWIAQNKDIAEKLAENQYIERAIEYLLEVGHHDEEKLKKAFTQSSEKLQQKMLTTKQQIEKRSMEQGMQRGMEQGMQQGIQTVAKNMLHQLRMSIDVVKQATGLPERELMQLAKS